jgi:hypothetical protein
MEDIHNFEGPKLKKKIQKSNKWQGNLSFSTSILVIKHKFVWLSCILNGST